MKLNIIVLNPNKSESLNTSLKEIINDNYSITILNSFKKLIQQINHKSVDAVCMYFNGIDADEINIITEVQRFISNCPLIVITEASEEKLIDSLIKTGVDDVIHPDHLNRLSISIKINSSKYSKPTQPLPDVSEGMHNCFQSFILLDERYKVQGFNDTASRYAKRILNLELRTGLDALELTKKHQKIHTYLISSFTGKPLLLETSILTANNNKLWFAINFMPIPDSCGKIKWVYVNAIDVTEQKLAEFAIRKAEESNKSLYENEIVGVYQTSIKGELLNSNAKLAQLLGYSSSKSLLNASRQYPKDFYKEPKRWRELITNLKRKGSLSEYVSILIDNDENEVWVSEFIRGLFDKNGKLVGFEGTVANITEYKKTQQKLKAAKDLIYNIYTHINLGICLASSKDMIIESNPALRKLCGYSPKELHGKPLSFLLQEKKHLSSGDDAKKNVKRHRTSEQKLLHKKGHILDVLVSESEIKDNRGELQKIISFSNITDQKRKQEELYRSKQRFRTIISNLPIIIVTTDKNGIYTFVDGKGLIGSGINSSKLLGKSAFDLFKNHKLFLRNLKRVLSGETVHGTFEMYNRHYDTSASPIFDANGNILGSLSISFDITNRIKIEEEKEKLRSQLLQSQKLEAIGTLSGGIAHEFNNLLAIILGNASLLTSKLPDELIPCNHLDRIISASERASLLTKKLLTFSRKKESEFFAMDINDSVLSVIELLEHTVDKRIKLIHDLEKDLPPILGDRHQLEQAMLNLAVNASDAISGKLDYIENGECQFRTRLIQPDDSLKRIYQLSTSTAHILLEIADNGIGISDDLLKKVFEPFFTTKGLGKGTGLGLSIVYGIISSHQGVIDINSIPNEGTVFSIYLPTIIDKSRSR